MSSEKLRTPKYKWYKFRTHKDQTEGKTGR